MRRTRNRSKGRGNSGKSKKSPSSSPDVFSEDSQGWHKHADPDYMCYGCESGVDAMDAHCRACNEHRGFVKKVREGTPPSDNKSKGAKARRTRRRRANKRRTKKHRGYKKRKSPRRRRTNKGKKRRGGRPILHPCGDPDSAGCFAQGSVRKSRKTKDPSGRSPNFTIKSPNLIGHRGVIA